MGMKITPSQLCLSLFNKSRSYCYHEMPLESWDCYFQEISTFLEYVLTYNLICNTYFVIVVMNEKECHPRFRLSQTFVSLIEFIANNINIYISKEVLL